MVPDDAPGDPFERLRSLPMGQTVEVEAPDGRVWRGTLVPSHGMSGDRIVQLKLDNGYNVGVRVEAGTKVRLVGPEPSGGRPAEAAPPSADHRTPDGRPWIALLTTGGTIASRVDYRTGAVKPVQGEREILDFYGELERDGPVHVVPVLDRLSEEIVPCDWITIAREIVRIFAEGARGVVVTHGTDTMGFTSAALAFLLEDLPGPVVLVGAQRSPDRPSSDGFTNMMAAARLARHPELGEVVVLMHDGLTDTRFAIHRGTRVRKMHSSRRDAFRSRNGPPIGVLDGETIELHEPFRHRSAGPARAPTEVDSTGGILWFYPGLTPERAEEFAKGLRGVVLAGSGLGHISLVHLPWIRRLTAAGVVLVMTTQCLEGTTDPYVYATGRDLLHAGVTYLGDLLPETAYAKLLWALGRSTDPAEIRALMLADRAGEFEPRHSPADVP
jgi:glutamyl-tRNA(Gln) amidotransferase subunit D